MRERGVRERGSEGEERVRERRVWERKSRVRESRVREKCEGNSERDTEKEGLDRETESERGRGYERMREFKRREGERK